MFSLIIKSNIFR